MAVRAGRWERMNIETDRRIEGGREGGRAGREGRAVQLHTHRAKSEAKQEKEEGGREGRRREEEA